MEFPDVHHKMSKKIAQLTKVIYHLNTKNDDNEYQMKQITSLYECEIEDILADAKRKIMDFKEALEIQKNDTRAKLAIEELTKRHDKERDEAKQEFTVFKKRAQNNEAILRSECEEQVSILTNDLNAVKDQFQSRLQAFTECQKGLEQKGYDSLEELRKMKDLELEATVQEYNEKYKSMLAKQLQAQDDLENSLNDQHRIQTSTLNTTHEQIKLSLNEKIASLQGRLDQSTTDGDTTLRINRDQSVTIQQLEDLVSEQRSNEEKLNNTIQTHIRKLNEGDDERKILDRKISTLSNTILQHEDTIRTWQSSCDQVKSENTTLSSEINVHKETIASLNTQVTSLLSEIQVAIEKNDTTASKLTSDISEHVGEIAHLRSLIGDVESDKKRLSETAFTQKQELDVLRKRLEHTSLDGEASSKAFENEILELKNSIQLEKEASEKKLADQQSDSDVRLTNLTTEFENKLTNCTREWTDKLSTANDQHSAQILSQQSDHNTAVGVLQTTIVTLKEEINILKIDLSNKQESISAANSHNSNQLTDLQTAREQSEDALRGQINLRIKEIQQKEEQLSAANTTISNLQNDVSQLQGDATAALAARDAYEASQEEKYNQLLQQQQSQQAELSQLTENELVKLTDELKHERTRIEQLQEELSTAQRNYTTSKHQLRDDLEKSREHEIQRQASSWNQIEETLKNEISDLRKQLSEAEDNLISKSDSYAADCEAFKSEKAKLAAEHKRQEADLKQIFTNDIDSLQARLKDDSKEKNRLLSESHEAAMCDLRHQHEESIKTLNNNHNGELSDLRTSSAQELAAQLTELNSSHNHTITSLHQTANSELEKERLRYEKEHQTALSVKQNKIKQYISDITDLDKQKTQLSKELKAQITKSTSEINTLELEIQNLIKEHSNKVSNLIQEHNENVRNLSATHTDAMCEVRNEFAETKAAMSEKRQRLENAIAELEYRYANRESRQEDIDKVNELLHNLSLKDEALIKAYNELRWYQLELANREENYNKVFGRQPTVAFGARAAGPQALADRKPSMTGLDKTKMPQSSGRAMSLVISKTPMQ